jgi:hypothetical protein
MRMKSYAPMPSQTAANAAPAPSRVKSTPVPARLGNQGMSGVLQAKRDGARAEAAHEQETADPWSTLSASGRSEAQALHDRCFAFMVALGKAQQAHMSVLRTHWLDALTRELARIGELDSDNAIQFIGNALEDRTDAIVRTVMQSHAEWMAVERRYLDAHRWLRSLRFSDATQAASRIEDLYQETKRRLDGGALKYITEEDYLELKNTLDRGSHIWLGALRASRVRARKLDEMMDVVADIRRRGEDPEKYVPGWNAMVQQEAAHLEALAVSTNGDANAAAQFFSVRDELLKRRADTLQFHGPPKKSVLEKAVDFVHGGVEAFVGIFIEAAKEAVDLVQINLHFSTGGRYEPHFISDMAAAAEQGATTGDLLKGMALGLIETPSRFLKACEDGDWEAIGREAVNLYLLARTIKEAPQLIKRLPELVAKTQRAVRILRARQLALEIKEPRLLPAPAPTPAASSSAGTSTGAGAPRAGGATPQRWQHQATQQQQTQIPPKPPSGQRAKTPADGVAATARKNRTELNRKEGQKRYRVERRDGPAAHPDDGVVAGEIEKLDFDEDPTIPDMEPAPKDTYEYPPVQDVELKPIDEWDGPTDKFDWNKDPTKP